MSAMHSPAVEVCIHSPTPARDDIEPINAYPPASKPFPFYPDADLSSGKS